MRNGGVKNSKNYMKQLAKIICILVLSLTAVIFLSDITTVLISHPKSYNLEKYLPDREVWLVLGTSKYLPDGRRNLFYIYRMNAAEELYNKWKIKKIIVSGDNAQKEYDETTAMRNDLIAAWIPIGSIYMDYAGFRTLDSVVRAKKVFGQDEITIISQEFHVQRAVVLAQFYWIDAVWFEAQEVPMRISPRVWIRERWARVKMWLDIITRKWPKFLWKPVDMSKPQVEISTL